MICGNWCSCIAPLFGAKAWEFGGKYDDLPEQSFYMVRGIEEVIAKAKKIAESAS